MAFVIPVVWSSGIGLAVRGKPSLVVSLVSDSRPGQSKPPSPTSGPCLAMPPKAENKSGVFVTIAGGAHVMMIYQRSPHIRGALQSLAQQCRDLILRCAPRHFRIKQELLSGFRECDGLGSAIRAFPNFFYPPI